MQIYEARLKEIVLEEVRTRLVERQWQQFKTAIREELAKEGAWVDGIYYWVLTAFNNEPTACNISRHFLPSVFRCYRN